MSLKSNEKKVMSTKSTIFRVPRSLRVNCDLILNTVDIDDITKLSIYINNIYIKIIIDITRLYHDNRSSLRIRNKLEIFLGWAGFSARLFLRRPASWHGWGQFLDAVGVGEALGLFGWDYAPGIARPIWRASNRFSGTWIVSKKIGELSGGRMDIFPRAIWWGWRGGVGFSHRKTLERLALSRVRTVQSSSKPLILLIRHHPYLGRCLQDHQPYRQYNCLQ